MHKIALPGKYVSMLLDTEHDANVAEQSPSLGMRATVRSGERAKQVKDCAT